MHQSACSLLLLLFLFSLTFFLLISLSFILYLVFICFNSLLFNHVAWESSNSDSDFFFYHIMQPSLMTLFIQIRPKYQNRYKTQQILMAHLFCSIPYCNYCASLFTKVFTKCKFDKTRFSNDLNSVFNWKEYEVNIPNIKNTCSSCPFCFSPYIYCWGFGDDGWIRRTLLLWCKQRDQILESAKLSKNC